MTKPAFISLVFVTACTATTATPVKITSKTTFDFTDVNATDGNPTTINGMNNRGELVGFSTAADGTNANFIRHSDGTFTQLSLGDPAGTANALNSDDTVVGAANGVALQLHAGAPTTLAPFASASSVAFGINDDGVIVGQYMVSDASMPGFADVGGKFTSVSPTAKATQTFLSGVNIDGLAAGFYSEDSDGATQHAFTYDTNSGKMALITDPSTARTAASPIVLNQFLSINHANQVAGYYQTTDGSQYGLVYDIATDTYMFFDHPLAAPSGGMQVTQITGIDDDAKIAGFYMDASGAQHGFIASPK